MNEYIQLPTRAKDSESKVAGGKETMTELFGAAFVVSFVCAFVVVCAVIVGKRSDQP